MVGRFPSVFDQPTTTYISMKNYRYTLEKYRGIKSRYTCPQCGRKYVFTRYIDTETNQYIADDVGKCNRLDKCGYHYTPKQYFSDNEWKNVCFVENTRKSTNKHSTLKPLKFAKLKYIVYLCIGNRYNGGQYSI